MSSSIEETSIPKLAEVEKRNRSTVPKLWKIPQVDKKYQKNIDELKKYQKTYTDILYKIGKDRYNLNKDFDFTVEVILPTGNFTDLSYHIISGPVVSLILTVVSTKEFEKLLHPILEEVRNSVHNKSVERIVELRKRQEEIKREFPPFVLYEELKDHKLEIKREQRITIFDSTTGITVVYPMPAESEPWRIMAHRAKMELIKLNKLVKEFESRENHGTSSANENKIPVKTSNNLER